jgi:hypothetical protein
VRAAALLLLAAVPAGAQTAASFGTAYVCEGGAVLRVAYLSREAGDAMAVVDWAVRSSDAPVSDGSASLRRPDESAVCAARETTRLSRARDDERETRALCCARDSEQRR